MSSEIIQRTQVWWIRHGETDSNIGLRTASSSAPTLTDRGYVQADQILKAFELAPELVITSPFIRTKQTAKPLLELFPGTLQVEWPIQEFSELSTANRKQTTGQERAPQLQDFWETCDPDERNGEGAETFREMIGRVDSALQAMNHLEEGLTAVFGHGLFMRALLWKMFASPPQIDSAQMRRFFLFQQSVWIANGAILKMEKIDGQWHVARPLVAHLET